MMLQIRPGLSVLPGDLERGKEDDGSSVALPRSSRSEDIGSQADVLASIIQKVKPYGAEHVARIGEEETENILEACWARGVEARTRAMQGAACGMARGQGGSPGGVGEPLGGLFGASWGLLVISWGPLGALRRFCVGLRGARNARASSQTSALLTFPRRRTPAAKLGRRQMLRSRGMPGQRSRPKRRRHHRCPHTSRTYWSFAADLLAASSAGLSPGSRMILAIVQAFSGLWSHLEARFGFLARNYSIKTNNLRNQSMFYTCRT